MDKLFNIGIYYRKFWYWVSYLKCLITNKKQIKAIDYIFTRKYILILYKTFF